MGRGRVLRMLGRVAVLGALAALTVGADKPSLADLGIPDLSQRINAFSLDFLKRQAAAEGAPANFIASPQGIFQGLAVSYIASGGTTRAELAKVFHFPEDGNELAEGLARLNKQMRKAGEHDRVNVALATSVWVDDTYAEFREAYLDQVRDGFGAELHRLKFADAGKASEEINAWVAETTHGKIKRIVNPADFASRSRPPMAIEEPGMVTVAATYFSADWKSRFPAKSTSPEAFHVDADTEVVTPMMKQNGTFLYAENESLKFIEMPYLGEDFSLYAVLPKETLSVAAMLDAISMETVVDLRRRAANHPVDVRFPKFNLTTRTALREALSQMGVRAAFDRGSANFDAMILRQRQAYRMYISEVVQDATVSVHEAGTEAAAATATVTYSFGCSAPDRSLPVEFHADRPFLFLILHNRSHSVLFAGWVSNPKELAE